MEKRRRRRRHRNCRAKVCGAAVPSTGRGENALGRARRSFKSCEIWCRGRPLTYERESAQRLRPWRLGSAAPGGRRPPDSRAARRERTGPGRPKRRELVPYTILFNLMHLLQRHARGALSWRRRRRRRQRPEGEWRAAARPATFEAIINYTWPSREHHVAA